MRLHWPLINLAILFIIPLVAAGYVLNFTNYKGIRTKEHGSFIATPYKLEFKNFAYLEGKDFANKWTLVYIQPEICSDHCQAQQKILHNLYTSLGSERDRVAIIATIQANINTEYTTDNILILDPHGLYIMQFTGTIDHSGLLKDLRRLLKYSHA